MAELELVVNGEVIQTNEFVSNVIHDVMLAMLSQLRGVEISKINF